MDIETAADLTSESQAKLAKAKSRGLTYTFIYETIDSDKSWEEIKDLLCLTLCNTNIHTYTLHFMDIQQWEKESLAGYVHRFKTEAKRCNFRNDAATIRIFIKGLKNAHSLVMCIYEKGPQMLTDAILEVEELNAAQQRTVTIIPPSTVNVMSHRDDCCFQCQEPGHITCNCPHIRCYEYNEYDHIVLVCPHRIPLLGIWANYHKPYSNHQARLHLRHQHEDRDRQSWSRSQSHFRRHHSLSHCNFYRDCSRSQHWDRCSYHRSSSQQSHSVHRGHSYNHRSNRDTPHQSHFSSSQHWSSSGYQFRDHSRSHTQPSYRSSRYKSCRSSSLSSRTKIKSHPKKNMKVMIDDPDTDYYSSDNHSSDLGEESRFFILTEPCSSVTPMNREGYLHMTRLQWLSSQIVKQ